MIAIRGMKESDHNCIYDNWKSSYRRAMSEVPKGVYYELMQRRIERLFEAGVRVAVAFPYDNEDYIIGWVAYGPADGVIHYVYVREIERGHGMARKLVNHALKNADRRDILATHWTYPIEKLERGRDHDMVVYAPSELEKL
jgi:GNAT superfamily N-acetyltransferase